MTIYHQRHLTLFFLIEQNDVSTANNAQFCHGLYRSCSRYQLKFKKVLTIPLPGGEYLQKILQGNF